MSIEAVAQIGAASGAEIAARVAPQASGASSGVSFAQMIGSGLDQVNRNLVQADAMVSAFALDDSVPVHRVTLALEQARLSFELMMQVRSRLVEGYQEIMRMQL
ncbi:MAG TPA: flagellar hook-basal body complex protein FliE [Caulobacteraceae bacterium]|nr:flagellar hook-basal body complex protein FliE [Caulobacteraceae bacterium]